MVWILCGTWCGQYTCDSLEIITDEPGVAPGSYRYLHAHHLCLQQKELLLTHHTLCTAHKIQCYFSTHASKGPACFYQLWRFVSAELSWFSQNHLIRLLGTVSTKWDWNVLTGSLGLHLDNPKNTTQNISLKVYLSILINGDLYITYKTLDDLICTLEIIQIMSLPYLMVSIFWASLAWSIKSTQLMAIVILECS